MSSAWSRILGLGVCPRGFWPEGFVLYFDKYIKNGGKGFDWRGSTYVPLLWTYLNWKVYSSVLPDLCVQDHFHTYLLQANLRKYSFFPCTVTDWNQLPRYQRLKPPSVITSGAPYHPVNSMSWHGTPTVMRCVGWMVSMSVSESVGCRFKFRRLQLFRGVITLCKSLKFAFTKATKPVNLSGLIN